MLRKNLFQMVITLILVFVLIYIFSVFSYANRLFCDGQVPRPRASPHRAGTARGGAATAKAAVRSPAWPPAPPLIS